MTDTAGVIAANLSGLNWAWFDQATPDLVTSPMSVGVAATTDGGGTCVLTVVSNLSVGGVGWLTITNSDGNPATLHKSFNGPVTVS